METEGVRRVRSGESGVAEYRNYAGRGGPGQLCLDTDLGMGLLVEESADQAFPELGSLRVGIILIVFGLGIAALIASWFYLSQSYR